MREKHQPRIATAFKIKNMSYRTCLSRMVNGECDTWMNCLSAFAAELDDVSNNRIHRLKAPTWKQNHTSHFSSNIWEDQLQNANLSLSKNLKLIRSLPIF